MAETVSMPKLGFDMAEGTVVRWMKREGEDVKKGEVLVEIETDKATVEVEAQASGVLRKQLVTEGAIVPVGAPIAILGAADEPLELPSMAKSGPPGLPTTPVEAPKAAPGRAAAGGDGREPVRAKASPVARRLAVEHAIDLAGLGGSGPKGRIVKRDVEAAIAARSIPGYEAAPSPLAASAITERANPPLSKLRTTIGKRMQGAKQQIPHFYLTAELDAAPLMALREQANARLPESGKLSVTDLLVKAAALALREIPNLNASFAEGQIVRHNAVNVGVAVAVDDGLLTVVVRDADQKPLRMLGQELQAMIARVREGRARPEEIEGSTFTVSNLGMYDIDHFIAIINPPEAAILAVGSVRDVPVIRGDEIGIGKRLKVTLSADHRVTDGAEAARWLQVLRGFVEDPLALLL